MQNIERGRQAFLRLLPEAVESFISYLYVEKHDGLEGSIVFDGYEQKAQQILQKALKGDDVIALRNVLP